MLKYVDRHHEETLLLVPGWAFDERIFDGLDLPYNYLLFSGISMLSLENIILQYVKEHQCQPLSLLGWSQGGLALSNFSAKHPVPENKSTQTADASLCPVLGMPNTRQGGRKYRIASISSSGRFYYA